MLKALLDKAFSWQFKSPKNFTVRTGYFWEVENGRKALFDKAFRKIL